MGSLRWAVQESSSSAKAHTFHAHIFRGPRMARPPTRRSGKKRSNNIAWNTSGLKMTLVPSQPPMLMPPMLPALLVRLAKLRARSPVSTILRRDTTRGTILNSREMPQKTSHRHSNRLRIRRLPYKQHPVWFRKDRETVTTIRRITIAMTVLIATTV